MLPLPDDLVSPLLPLADDLTPLLLLLADDLITVPLPSGDLISPPAAPLSGSSSYNAEKQALARILVAGFNFDHEVIAATCVYKVTLNRMTLNI